uniref:Glycoprotein M6Bb n=1 Tax=Sinocyclocheilus rhinocerous TaxID=307959 RepID=A0A673HEK1_9TELE
MGHYFSRLSCLNETLFYLTSSGRYQSSSIIILDGPELTTLLSLCVSAGCFECCIKCLGGVPYASLVATILCFCGVALFCGCGHVALTGTLSILENHFSRITTDHATLKCGFLLYIYILLGFYTSSAVKELHSEFKTTVCGRCISDFICMKPICRTLTGLSVFYLSYHLFIVACAGAGATVIALIHYLMILSANWAYLKDASHLHAYQDIKMKEERELQDIQSRSKECLNSYS